jgi:hypothetical protein
MTFEKEVEAGTSAMVVFGHSAEADVHDCWSKVHVDWQEKVAGV